MVRYKSVLCAAIVLMSLIGCGKSHSDTTELIDGQVRTLGQDPPDWLILHSGGLAYIGLLGDEACSSKDEFLVYNSTGDATSGCTPVTLGTWVRVREVDALGDHKYVAAISPPEADQPVSYLGASELSPDIPTGTELLVHDDSDSSSNDSDTSDNSGVDLTDDSDNTIGELLDHTKVRVVQLNPSADGTTTNVVVKVVSGKLAGVTGHVDLDSLVATSGDDELDDFLDAKPGN